MPECQARVQRPVTDDMGHGWKPGDVVPVDIAREGGKGGQFCAHGGACLPRQTAEGQAALALTNCKVGPAIGGGDYRLVPDAHLAGAAAAAAMEACADVEQKLSALGFSNAAAGSLAEDTVSHPRSRKAQQVHRALRGSREALSTLQAQYP